MISENIDKMIMSSVKDGDKAKAGVYRLLKNEFLKHNTSKGAKPLDDAAEVSIIQKMVKQRQESIKAYQDNGRQELADMEKAEADILSELLPPIPTRDDIEDYIRRNHPDGIQKKDMGNAIREIKESLPGADGKTVSECVRNFLV